MFGSGESIDPQKVAVYVRWSTDEQSQGTTLQVQSEACEFYCKSQGWNFNPALLFVDDGYSGGTLKRPALTKLRAAVQAREIECVVVFKLDRLSRRVVDCVSLVMEEWKGKCAVYSSRENLDTNSPAGKMMFNILASFAEYERDVIRERTYGGKLQRVQEGRSPGQYPFGYKRKDEKLGGYALDGWDEEEQVFTGKAAVARRIFDEYLGGKGHKAISTGLNADGIPSPSGKDWWPESVQMILRNQMYAGTFVFGHSVGSKARMQEPTVKIEDSLPPVVTKAEFETVQRIYAERTDVHPRQKAGPFVLSGLLRCGKCGGPMFGDVGSAGVRYYVCNRKVNFADCPQSMIRAETLEKQVLEAVKAAFAPTRIADQLARIEADIKQNLAEKRGAVEAIMAEIQEYERNAAQMHRDYFAKSLTPELFSSLAKTNTEQLAVATARLDQARAAYAEASVRTVDTRRMALLAESVDAWDELTLEESKQVLRDLSAKLVADQAPRPQGRRSNTNPINVEWTPRVDLTITTVH